MPNLNFIPFLKKLIIEFNIKIGYFWKKKKLLKGQQA